MYKYIKELNMDLNCCSGDLKNYERIFVVWSGGYDSTLALINTLIEAKRRSIPVTTISIESDLIGDSKMKFERRSRTSITKKLNLIGFKFESITIKANLQYKSDPDPFGGFVPREGFSQPQIWLSLVTPFICSKSLLVFGYIRGDDFLLQKSSFLSLLDLQIQLGFKQNIGVAFPLMFTNKYTILDNLHYEYNDIFKLCWTCESPHGSLPCGICHSCQTELEALRYLKIQKENRLKYSDKMCDANKIRRRVLSDIDRLNKSIIKKEQREEQLKEQKESGVVRLQEELQLVDPSDDSNNKQSSYITDLIKIREDME